MLNGHAREVDYTGVSAKHLKVLVDKYGLSADTTARRKAWCDGAGVSYRRLNQVIYGENTFISLDTADRICMGMNLDVSSELVVIPSGHTQAAKKMALDEFWVNDIEPTPNELRKRVTELRKLRLEVLEI